MHPLVLALGLGLPMTKFIRSILIFYGVTPSQLSAVAWSTILRFDALCDLYAPDACHCEVFSTTYLLRKTTLGSHYFVPKIEVKKIIVNIVDSDCGMRDTVVQVSGPRDANSSESGVIGVVWNLDAGTHGGTLPTADVEVKLRKLTTIDFNNRNWSWLLNWNRPPALPVILRVLTSGKGCLPSNLRGLLSRRATLTPR